jgi:hypothetical protein
MSMINTIKNDVFDKLQKMTEDHNKNFINNLYKSISEKSELTSVIVPIHYLFDKNISSDIGNTEDNLQNVVETLKLNDLFNLDYINYFSMPVPNHATILYKFVISERNYIYYSNSGLGIHNHIRDYKSCKLKDSYPSKSKIGGSSSHNKKLPLENEELCSSSTCAPKIYYVKDDELFKFIPKYITFIIDMIKKMNAVQLLSELQNNIIFNEIDIMCTNFPQLKLDKSDFNKILVRTINSNAHNLQNLCYALLNYIVGRYSNKEAIQECSFNHVIIGADLQDFTNKIKELAPNNKSLLELFYYSMREKPKMTHNQSLSVLYPKSEDRILVSTIEILDEKYALLENMIGTNERINNELSSLAESITSTLVSNKENRLNEFANFIKEFNRKLKKKILNSSCPTLKFKLEQFNIDFNYIYGILNNVQHSGSCTFYSYYNLGFNMKILKLFLDETKTFREKIKELLKIFIVFHYKMIYLLCLSLDVKYIPDTLDKFHENNFYNYTYLYNIMKKKNLLNEIREFYKSNSFMFFDDTAPIDGLLKFKLEGQLTERIYLTRRMHEGLFTNLFDYLDITLFKIRTSINSDDLKKNTIKDNLRKQFDDIKNSISKLQNVYSNSEYYNSKDYINYIGTMEDIYLIYLLILIKNYTEPEYFSKLLTNDYSFFKNNSNRWDSKYCLSFFNKFKYDFGNSNDTCFELEDLYNKHEDTNENNPLLCRLNNNELINLCKIIENVKYFEELYNYEKNSLFNEEVKKYENNNTDFTEINSFFNEEENDYESQQNEFTDNKVMPNKEMYSIYKNSIKNKLSHVRTGVSIFKQLLGIELNYCKYIVITSLKNDTTFQPIIRSYDIKYEDYDINKLLRQYYYCKIGLNNKMEIKKNKYNIIKENVMTAIRNLIYNMTDSDFNLAITDVTLLMSDSQYVIMHRWLEKSDTPKYIPFFDTSTKIYIINKKLNNDDRIKFISLLNDIFYTNDSIAHSEHFVLKFINYLGDTFEKVLWIEDLNIKIDSESGYMYNEEKYLSLDINVPTPNDEKESDVVIEQAPFNGIRLALLRFGFNFNDISNYLFLVSEKCLTKREKKVSFSFMPNVYNDPSLYEFNENNGNILILIHNYMKCIQIEIKNKQINKCYIIDKNSKYELLFNLNIKEYPFMSQIPTTCPYLCYYDSEQKTFIIDFIISNIHTFNRKMEKYKTLFYKITENKIKENIFHMYQMKIAPSLIFPVLTSFNKSMINNLYNVYSPECHRYNMLSPRVDVLKKSYIGMMSEKYIMSDMEPVNIIILSLKSILSKVIDFDKDKIDAFTKILKTNYNEKFVEDFLNENRLCSVNNMNKTVVDESKYVILDIDNLIMKTKKNIIFDENLSEFIFLNIKKFIILMELNIMKKIIVNNITCWNVQTDILILNNLLSFNEIIQTEYFYYFEILFLLQNEYIFKKTQLIKYKEIRDDLENENKSLKLHQFMMGKGKTSVFTPLLSFGIKFLTDKQPTVITSSHLVDQTKQYMLFTEYLFDGYLNVNVLSDFNAKKRWIENTDKNFKETLSSNNKINLSNEFNIIDEFDSHHDYLRSMFNYVLDKKVLNNKQLFEYIFNFTLSGINKTKLEIPDTIQDIKNMNVLNTNLNISYEQTRNMVYNKDYGFSFIIFNEERNNNGRLCSPFVRKDTPIKNSNFSNMLLRLILTFKTYIINFNGMLQDYDFEYIEMNPSIINDILNKKLDSLYLNSELKKIDLENKKKNYIKNELIKIFKTEFKSEKLLMFFLFEINKNFLNVTEKQLNMSFQDIIYNKYKQWQVGYTGTSYLRLNNYENEDYVFRSIIEDPDEKIEVLLALNSYGYLKTNRKNIIVIKPIDATLKNIIAIIKDTPRGIIDLFGLYVNNNNVIMAGKIKDELKEKRIIYFDNNNKPFEFNSELNQSENYRGVNEDNFYFYDQAHVVGTDIKQPQDGHVVILIGSKTRMTDFAQAIFRFRNLNKGTYISIVVINNHELEYNANTLYKLLTLNENNFNDLQKNGLEYQLLKAIVRSESNDYEESDLNPEFFREKKYNLPQAEITMKRNIKNLSIDIQNNLQVTKIYETLIKQKNILSLVYGIGDESATEQEKIQEKNQEKNQEKSEEKSQEQMLNVNVFINDTTIKFIMKFSVFSFYNIKHLNCERCIQSCCIRLFKSDNIQINNKTIYISYNILSLFSTSIDTNKYETKYKINEFKKVCDEYALDPTKGENINKNYKIHNDRICFVEFNNMILIENEDIGIDYYINKLPVYDFTGKLMEHNLSNVLNNRKDKNNLEINSIFVKMVGIKQLLTNKINISDKELYSAVEDLIPLAKIILKYHFLTCTVMRYNVSDPLVTALKNLDIDLNIKYDIIPNNNNDLEKLINIINMDWEHWMPNIKEYLNSDYKYAISGEEFKKYRELKHNKKDDITTIDYYTGISSINYDFKLSNDGYVDPIKNNLVKQYMLKYDLLYTNKGYWYDYFYNAERKFILECFKYANDSNKTLKIHVGGNRSDYLKYLQLKKIYKKLKYEKNYVIDV